MNVQLKTITIKEITSDLTSAIQTIIPGVIDIGKIECHKSYVFQPEIGVLIGITGEIPSRLLIDGEGKAFSLLSNLMFGMALEGEMLESFVGEFGNMISGNMCTNVSLKGIHLDITHPTVLVGQTKMSGFKSALVVPVSINDVGNLRVSLLLEEEFLVLEED